MRTQRKRRFLSVVALCGWSILPAASFPAAAQVGPGGPGGSRGVTPSGIDVRTLYRADVPVLLLAVGEIDAAHAGPELLAVDSTGRILRLDSGDLGWSVRPLPINVEPGHAINNRPAINIGDVHPGFPGNEVVVETANIVSVLVQPSPGAWQRQVVLDDEFFGITWGVRIGDIDPARPGQELFYITEGAGDISSGYFAHLDGVQWRSEYVFGAEVGMDSGIGNSNPDSPGNEIVVCTEMGPVYEITPEPGSPLEWPRRTLWDNFDDAGWTLRIADIVPGLPGNEIAYGTRYSDRLLLSHRGAGGTQVEVVLTGAATDPMTMWDIAVGDVVPASTSLEIVGVDELGMVYLAAHDGSNWSGGPLWRDEAGPLYAAVVADFLPESPGAEIVVAGASGAITLISGLGGACAADFSQDGTLNSQDFFDYLAAFFAGSAGADFNRDGVINSQDFFDYLGAFLAGCG